MTWRSWFKMTQEEADSVIDSLIPKSSRVYEIGCGGKSAIKFGSMLKKGEILSYKGVDINPQAIEEAKAQGLEAELVQENYDHQVAFKSLKGNGIVAMLGLPEVVPEIAKMYVQQASDSGLIVAAYPPIE